LVPGRGGEGTFCLHHQLWGSSSLLFNGYWKLFSPEVKWLKHKGDNSPPFSAKIKNVWNYTSYLPYNFMAWCLISTGTTLPLELLTDLQRINLVCIKMCASYTQKFAENVNTLIFLLYHFACEISIRKTDFCWNQDKSALLTASLI